MAISFKSLGSSITYQPIDTAGTYDLTVPLKAGVYRVTSGSIDTTMNFKLKTSLGHSFDTVLKQGLGRLYVPVDVTSIIAPGGTYPVIVGFEKINIPQPATPDATFAWNANPSGNATGKFTFTTPSGITSTRIYWEDGTNELITSGSDVTPKSYVTSSGQTRSPIIIQKNAIGVESLGQSLTTSTSLLNSNVVALTSSGIWTVPSGVTTADVLVVAGGGTGGMGGNSAGAGGGGGAGGVVVSTGYSLTPGSTVSYTIGAGGVSANQTTNPGGNSTFGSITATGGGGGGYESYRPAQNGGSGGGGGGYSTNWPGGTGIAGQGYAGGSGGSANTKAGGGGATAPGTVGNGGAGYHLANFASSLNGVYVGGGGGGGGANGGAAGTGGVGGGGNGGANNTTGMTSGTANTGGGGGGRGDNASGNGGGNGGSGVVYVKYSI